MQLSRDMLTHGVYVVAARHRRKRGAMTLSWATQAGRDRIIICVGPQSDTRQLILDSRAFGLSVLRSDQLELAKRFSKGCSAKQDKMSGVPFEIRDTGSPLLRDSAAAFDCLVESVYGQERRGFKLIVGRIVLAQLPAAPYEPLLYREEDYA